MYFDFFKTQFQQSELKKNVLIYFSIFEIHVDFLLKEMLLSKIFFNDLYPLIYYFQKKYRYFLKQNIFLKIAKRQ